MSLLNDRVAKRVAVRRWRSKKKTSAAAMAEELAMGVNDKRALNTTVAISCAMPKQALTGRAKSLARRAAQRVGWELIVCRGLWTGAHYQLLGEMVQERVKAGQKPRTGHQREQRGSVQNVATFCMKRPR